SITVFRYRKEISSFIAGGGTDDHRSVRIEAAHTAGGAAHDTNLRFIKANGLSIRACDDDLILSGRRLYIEQLIVITQRDRNLSIVTDRIKLLCLHTLDQTLLRDEEEIFGLGIFLHRHKFRDMFVLIQLQKIDDRNPFRCTGGIWYIISFQTVDLAQI